MENIIFVAASAQAGGDGSDKKPLASLTEARDLIRRKRADGIIKDGDPVTVLIRGGEYRQDHTFELDSVDGGVSYKAYEGETVVITGGRTLPGEKFYKPEKSVTDPIRSKYPEAADRIVAYDLGADGVDCGRNLQIYWNGNRGVVSRFPNTGYSYMTQVENLPCDKDRTWAYNFTDGDRVVQTWRSFEGVRIVGNFYFDWASTAGCITGFDAETGRVGIECNGEARDNGRYYFDNVFDELDTPGEYFIDMKKKILYFCPEGDITNTSVVITQCEKYVIAVKADNVTIEGLTVEAGCENLVLLDGCDLTLRGCTIRRGLITGLHTEGYRHRIEGNEFYTIGAECLDMGGGDMIKLTPSESVISDNIFHDFGEISRVYAGGIYFRGRGITCIHNEFYRGPHLAMSVTGSELDIEYNYIHDVCYEANDAGAVYLGGWAPQDVIFDHNIIKHIVNIYHTGNPNGYYNDDGGGGKTIRSNLFIDIGGNAFAMGGGRDNIIEDNIMINTRLAYDERLYYDQWEMHNALYRTGGLWNNLLRDPSYGSREWAIRYPRTLLINATRVRDYYSRFVPCAFGHTVVRNNVTFNEHKYRMDVQPDTRRLSNFRDNIDYESIDDVGFVDYENGDYRLKPESRLLYDLPDFRACDFSLVGVRRNRAQS